MKTKTILEIDAAALAASVALSARDELAAALQLGKADRLPTNDNAEQLAAYIEGRIKSDVAPSGEVLYRKARESGQVGPAWDDASVASRFMLDFFAGVTAAVFGAVEAERVRHRRRLEAAKQGAPTGPAPAFNELITDEDKEPNLRPEAAGALKLDAERRANDPPTRSRRGRRGPVEPTGAAATQARVSGAAGANGEQGNVSEAELAAAQRELDRQTREMERQQLERDKAGQEIPNATRIARLKLHPDALAALKDAGFATIGQVRKAADKDLLALKKFGRASLASVRKPALADEE